MSASDTWSIDVDVTSPGQFFACCGVLELASRVHADATGWFEGSRFLCSASEAEIAEIIRSISFKQPPLSAQDVAGRNGKKLKDPSTTNPIDLKIGGAGMTLDWWLRPLRHDGLKLWSGSNNIRAFFEDAINFVHNDRGEFELARSGQLKRQPFFYAASRPLNEVEFGVSMDKIGRVFQHLPYIELLTIIALQRFHPARLPDGNFGYSTWSERLPASLAAAVVGGAIPSLQSAGFAFPVIDRDPQGHKQFTRAERKSHV